MKKEIQWLVLLGGEQGVFDSNQCIEFARTLEDDIEIVPFAESLLKEDICTDFDAMQALVEEAYDRAQEEDPPSNPFITDSSESKEGPGESEVHGAAKVEPDTAPSPRMPESMPDLGQLNRTTDGSSAEKLMPRLLRACREFGASDLHLSANARPFVRHNRRVVYLSEEPLSAEAADVLNTCLLSENRLKQFRERQDLDFALALDEEQRFRVNLMMHRSGASGTYRLVPDKIPSLEEVGFDDLTQIRKLLSYNNGLILVTGPIGSGKTVTVSAMMDEMNRNRSDHLIAVEEPIEIVQHSKNCHITQREVGLHTNTFSSALKGALRQDPDIIVIGEMRDLETIEMAISAAETGHLVIGTLHTNDAANTLNRVLDVFPAAQQMQIRVMLSHALRGIICQNLVPAVDGSMALAYEILISNTAVRSLISENKPEGLVNVMETGSSEGMCLMDKSILSLWEKDKISDEVALASLRSKMKRHQLSELIKLQQPTT